MLARAGMSGLASSIRHCAGGADMKEVQETLGHATLSITSDTYTAVFLELQRANADANLIPRKPPKAA